MPTRPTQEELKADIAAGMTMSQIAMKYGYASPDCMFSIFRRFGLDADKRKQIYRQAQNRREGRMRPDDVCSVLDIIMPLDYAKADGYPAPVHWEQEHLGHLARFSELKPTKEGDYDIETVVEFFIKRPKISDVKTVTEIREIIYDVIGE